MNRQTKLLDFYHAMLSAYGPQNWWPADSPFEIMVGAVLTQNTSWQNVEKAILNLKNADVLNAEAIDQLSLEDLAQLIKPAGYFNIKAKRLKNLIHWLCSQYDGDISPLARQSIWSLQEQLLAINGIGRETADSIILYALEKPTFVVDTYTYRILTRHFCIDVDADYERIKDYCQSQLEEDVTLYNEYHALLVCVGKNHCKPKAKCAGCPLEKFNHCTNPQEM
ncbi:MAG: endonuclease III domain-containing protein [Phycisphaerae bacterium]|nr:endonuclease III domain-containing protein [Phycisphaerae bacterium]